MKKSFLLPLIVCFSCSAETDFSAPKNLVPVEKMIPVIVDLQILESHFQRLYQRADLYKESLDSSSLLIFDQHHITKGAFDSSYSYYAQDVDVIYAIYEAALDSVNFRLSQPQLIIP